MNFALRPGLLLLLLLMGRALAGVAMGCMAVAAQPAVVRIVALGDSTTARATSWAPEIREVYADCLARRLQSAGIGAHVYNAGIGDTTTRDALERLDRDVRVHRPDVVVVQFGINDSYASS